MVRITRQQLFVLFVLIMFIGSGIAYALMSVMEFGQPKQKLIFNGPLSNADESVFLRQNKVIARYFFSENCTTCPEVTKTVGDLFQDFGGNLIIEEIDVDEWPNFTSSLEIKEVPALYLKGSTIDLITGNITYDDAFKRICDLFFTPIEQCALVSP
ncbi:MAG: thioredoxin domain-containing protein [Candidatus Aenigmatarchaeota archaeon]|nr:hypothetical protein [Candidatus Aenigmarchaeota archaeon]